MGLLSVFAAPASACSLEGCTNRGIELRSDFAVKIRHADKPLPGVAVEITGPKATSGAKKFTVTTGNHFQVDGVFRDVMCWVRENAHNSSSFFHY